MPMKKKTARPKKPLPTDTFEATLTAFLKTFYTLAYPYGRDRIWRDFCEMAAIALTRLDTAQFEAREARYLEVIKPYKHDANRFLFPQLLAHVIRMMEFGHRDVLGEIWHRLELRGANGQVWTPYHVAHLMSEMTIGTDTEEVLLGRKGYFTLSEPACGTGVMFIAAAESMLKRGLNPQKQMYVRGIDVDAMCVHMSVIQASLYGLPATFEVKDALKFEAPRETWRTLMHFIGQWGFREAVEDAIKLLNGITVPPDAEEEPPADAPAPDPQPAWAKQAWEKTGVEDRLRYAREAGVSDPAAVMATIPPKALLKFLPQPPLAF